MSENYFYSSLSAQEIEDTLVGAVVFNSDMGLTTSQKAQARANIGAGENDTKVIIMGFFDTLADLQSQIPVGTVGDVYAVGTQSPYDIYIWDATHIEWKDNGPLSFSDAIIDDGDISLSSTWSSQKINTQISSIDLTSLISDSTTSANKTWSSNKISTELSGKATPSDVATAVAALVDDSTTSASKTWSSQKIAAEIDKCKWHLLWTNADDTADFAAQDVSVNLSDYTEIMIYWKQLKNDTYYFTQTNLIVASASSYLFNNSAGKIVRRGFTFASDLSKITFDGGQQYQSYGTATASNGYAIPVKIYARKGVAP